MLKKGKKTHQSPSSKTKTDEERKNWSGFYLFIYFFRIVSTEDWSFGASRQAMVPVQMKVYQRRQKKKKEKKNKK